MHVTKHSWFGLRFRRGLQGRPPSAVTKPWYPGRLAGTVHFTGAHLMPANASALLAPQMYSIDPPTYAYPGWMQLTWQLELRFMVLPAMHDGN